MVIPGPGPETGAPAEGRRIPGPWRGVEAQKRTIAVLRAEIWALRQHRVEARGKVGISSERAESELEEILRHLH